MMIKRLSASHPFPLGIGWRPEIALMIERRRDLSFVEVVAENIELNPLPSALDQLRQRGLSIIPHGISLSLGGAERPDPARATHLARLAERLDAPFVSEHIAFVRAGGAEAGHLLPVPRTRAAIEMIVENIGAVKKLLPVPLALENISTLFEWPGAEMDEAAFVTEILERTDCLLLLDLANVWANAKNLGGNAIDTIGKLPLHRIAYCHVGGGYERDGVYHDTHAHPVPAGVFEVVEQLFAIAPVPPAVMLERDDHFPPEEQMNRELDAIVLAASGTRRSSSAEARRAG